MPRCPRLDSFDLIQHVIAQGIARCTIFVDDHDRAAFVKRLLRVLRETRTVCLAWAFVGNHVHLVLQTTEETLGRVMHRILGPYAQDFNRRHGRVGRLFRDRYLSRPVENDDDLCGLIGYVLLNPLRAGIVATLEELVTYPWTSLAEVASPPRHREAIVDRTYVLGLFGTTAQQGIEGLLSMLHGLMHEDAPNAPLAPRGVRLSQRDRVDLKLHGVTELMERSRRVEGALARERTARVRRVVLRSRGWTLDRCVTRACEVTAADEQLMRGGGRCRAESRARSLLAYFGAQSLGANDTQIARAAGVSQQCIYRARVRGSELAQGLGVTWGSFFGVVESGALDKKVD